MTIRPIEDFNDDSFLSENDTSQFKINRTIKYETRVNHLASQLIAFNYKTH